MNSFFVQMNNLLKINISKELNINTLNSEITTNLMDHNNQIHFFGRIGDIIHDFVLNSNLNLLEVNKYNSGEISNAWLIDNLVYVHDFRSSYLGIIRNKKINVIGWYGEPQPNCITYDALNNEVSGCNYSRSTMGDWRIFIVNNSLDYYSDCAYYRWEEEIGTEILVDLLNIEFTEREVLLNSALAEDITQQNKDLMMNLFCESIATINGVENSDDSSKVLFPNPARNKIYVDPLKDQKAIIMDCTGNFVKEEIISNEGINVSELMNGIYFLKIREGVMKFIKY